MILLFPSLPETHQGPYPFEAIHTYVRDVAEQNGARVLDLRRSLADSALDTFTVSPYDGHPNVAVHEIAARALADLVTEADLVPRGR